jgi:small subunit ribosomal protein S17
MAATIKKNTSIKANNSPLSMRGRTFVGTIISTKMQKTVTVEWERKNYLKKFERFEKRRSKIKAHNPENINAKEGDVVKIKECRPISKTKNFVVIEILGKEKGFQERMELEQESKVTRKEKGEPVEENKENKDD